MKYIKIFLLTIPIIFATGCDEDTRYEILSFFFDGVPNPHKQEKHIETTQIDSSRIKRRLELVRKADLKMFFHEPFKERMCGECHNLQKGNKLLEQPPALCFNCHDDFLDGKKFKHGPTAAGYCTQCHHPHMEKQQFMLKRKGQALCLECHDRNDINKKEIHLEIEDTDCWECHDPHASDERFML